MREWVFRHRRFLAVLLAAWAVAGSLLGAGSVGAGFTFLDNADSVTKALGTTRAALGDALALADASLESGARSVDGLAGALGGSADVVAQAAGFADRVAGAADSLAGSLAAVSLLGMHPFQGPAGQFSGLASSAREVGASLTGIGGSLASTGGQLPDLASNLRRLGQAMTTIDASFGDLPFGPQLADQFRLAAILLFAAAGWFLVPSLACLLAGVVLWRAAARSGIDADRSPVEPGRPAGAA